MFEEAPRHLLGAAGEHEEFRGCREQESPSQMAYLVDSVETPAIGKSPTVACCSRRSRVQAALFQPNSELEASKKTSFDLQETRLLR